VRAPFALRRLAATLCAGLLALALTGCGSDTTTDASSSTDHSGAGHSSTAAGGRCLAHRLPG
jgi:hypothetical protein